MHEPDMLAGTPFEPILTTLKKQSRKWSNYFQIYHRHLAQYIDQSPTIIEIGVDGGGSLETWARYFGYGTRVVGIDILPRCLEHHDPDNGIEVYLGDQGDPEFLKRLHDLVPAPTIVIDDGGHRMHQQILTFEMMFPTIPDKGTYICEDLSTSYVAKYGGAYRKPGTAVEYFKGLVDDLQGYKHRQPTPLTSQIAGIYFYDQVVVLDKVINRKQPREVKFKGHV